MTCVERAARIRQVLEHVVERDDVIALCSGQVVGKETGDDARRTRSRNGRDARVRLQADHRITAPRRGFDEPPVRAADIEQAALLRLAQPVEHVEHALEIRPPQRLQCIVPESFVELRRGATLVIDRRLQIGSLEAAAGALEGVAAAERAHRRPAVQAGRLGRRRDRRTIVG